MPTGVDTERMHAQEKADRAEANQMWKGHRGPRNKHTGYAIFNSHEEAYKANRPLAFFIISKAPMMFIKRACVLGDFTEVCEALARIRDQAKTPTFSAIKPSQEGMPVTAVNSCGG